MMMPSVLRSLALAAVCVLTACAGSAGGGAIPDSRALPATVLSAQSVLSDAMATDAVRPYTPGVDADPLIAWTPMVRTLSAAQASAEARFSAELSDPTRAVWHPSAVRKQPQNVVTGGNGESVGLFTSPTFSANGSVVNFGVQKDYVVAGGGNFFHTHQFVNNQCFEYGINYSGDAPTLFGYNWCSGGNTPQGWMNIGLVGDPGGVLKTWDATGNGWLFKWDAANKLYEISLEEVKKSDGWHLLGYNWTQKTFIDIMNGHGVTGKKSGCCGWSVFEIHVAPGASCGFDAAFPRGQELLYDTKMQALIGNTWTPLNKIRGGGFTYRTQIDCAELSAQTGAGYVSPYFSGGFISPAAGAHAGDWWLIQR